MKPTRRMITVMLATSTFALIVSAVNAARAQCTVSELAKLTASDGAEGDWFADCDSVALSGDIAVIGAIYDDDNGPESGSAYVFRRYEDSYPCVNDTDCEGVGLTTCVGDVCEGVAWGQEAKLLPSDGAPGDMFGTGVGISGDTTALGAVGDQENGIWSGSAYVFRRYEDSYPCVNDTDCEGVGLTTCVGDVCEGVAWVQEAKLLPSDGATPHHFGRTVRVSGDTVVVTAANASANTQNSGAAYVFEKPLGGWVDMPETAKLVASDGAAGDELGISAAVDGDTIVIGAQYDDDNGIDSGSAYVFVKPGEGWGSVPPPAVINETAKLLPTDGGADDFFGNSTGVAISGDTVLVGAYGDDDNGSYSGSAYVFVKPSEGWGAVPPPAVINEAAKLAVTGGAEGDQFGCAVAIAGSVAVIAARAEDNSAGVGAGAAYVYERPSTGWEDVTEPQQKLLAFDGAEGDWFGCSAALFGDIAVIGAYRRDDNGENSGAAYVFDLTDTNGDGVIDVCDCNMNGVPDENEPTRSRTFCVKCDSPSPPNDCSDGSQWSFMLDWLGAGPNFEELNCGPVTPTSGTTAVDMAEEFVNCINATVCQSITAAQFGSGKCLKVTVPGDVTPDICVGEPGGPPNDCQPPWVFNPTLIEVFLSGTDCNNNGEDDAIDIALGTSPDENEDGIPDECGACCGPGPCIQVIQSECDSMGRLYRGDGTTCAQEQCDDIPAVSEWGLIVLTLLVLAAGTVVLRRRRAARA